MRVASAPARAFYEIEAVREAWSTREMERQIASLLFERLSMNRDKEQVLALARRGQEIAVPGDVPAIHPRDLPKISICWGAPTS